MTADLQRDGVEAMSEFTYAAFARATIGDTREEMHGRDRIG